MQTKWPPLCLQLSISTSEVARCGIEREKYSSAFQWSSYSAETDREGGMEEEEGRIENTIHDYIVMCLCAFKTPKVVSCS